MNRESILEKLTDIFRDVFDDESMELDNTTSPNDVDDWDSLAQIRLIVSVEGDFNIKFNINELGKLKNVGDLISAIERVI